MTLSSVEGTSRQEKKKRRSAQRHVTIFLTDLQGPISRTRRVWSVARELLAVPAEACADDAFSVSTRLKLIGKARRVLMQWETIKISVI